MSIHKVYKTLTRAKRLVVDNAWDAVAKEFRSAGYDIPRDDRAEVLVEAIATALSQSRCIKLTSELLLLKEHCLNSIADALEANDTEGVKQLREELTYINAQIGGVAS